MMLAGRLSAFAPPTREKKKPKLESFGPQVFPLVDVRPIVVVARSLCRIV
jgi:hypothetical protein